MASSASILGLGALLLGCAAVACSKPEPPRVTPESARVTTISSTGLGVSARLDVYNPNSAELKVRSVKAKVVLDGKVDLGTVSVAQPIVLPPRKSVKLDVPLSLRWQGVQTLGSLAAAQKNVPYVVDGTVELGGDSFSVEVPFKLDGVITREQLVQAAIGSIPGIPGLPSLR